MPDDRAMSAICLDIDNVIARTDEVMRRVIFDFTGGRVKHEYNHIVEFDYHRCKDANGSSISVEEWKRIHDLFSEPRYLWQIQPEPGVQTALTLISEKFDIHLATSRLPKARRTTIEWLDNYNFPSHDLHFLKHGEKHMSLGKFAAAVEDHYEQAVEFARAGTPAFLLQHPWNRGKPNEVNVRWVDGWEKLTEALLAQRI